MSIFSLNVLNKFRKNLRTLEIGISKKSWLYQLAGAITISMLSTSNHRALQDLQLTNFALFTFIYISTFACALSLLTEPILPQFLRQLSVWPYLLTVFAIYITVFTPSFMVIITNLGQMQLIVMIFNSLILSHLIGWHITIIVILSCTVINIQLCQNLITAHNSFQGFTAESKFQVVYFLLSTVVVFTALLKPKQEEQELIEEIAENLSQQLEDSNKQIFYLSNLKQTFLRNLEHETNTPLTGVHSMSQALGDCYDKLTDEERKRAIDTITTSSERLISYANNLIDTSRLISSYYQPKFRQVNLSNLVEECIRKCKRLYILKEFEDDRDIILNIEPNISADCDEYYIKRSFENLIINSIQYCKKGRIEISLTKVADKGMIKFIVKDSGIGVPQEELEAIFDPFVTSSKTTTPAGGRGMGLSLVKAAAQIHKGTVEAKSNKVEGSTFILTLPAKC